MSDARTTPPSFDELVGLIKKLFTDYLEDVMKSSPGEIEKSWQRYKTLNHLIQAASQPPAVKGAVWVKASERLPKEGGKENKVIIRGKLHEAGYNPWPFVAFGFRNFDPQNPQMYFELGSKSYCTNEDIEWLDESGESPTAAGDVPYMRKEDYEQISINIDAGMPELEASFQSGYSSGHDAGYAKAKREAAAGDGKEAIEFAEWAMNNFGIARDSSWEKIWAGPGPKQFTTAQLYDIFKNRPQ